MCTLFVVVSVLFSENKSSRINIKIQASGPFNNLKHIFLPVLHSIAIIMYQSKYKLEVAAFLYRDCVPKFG